MSVGAVMSLSRDLAHLVGVAQADVELALHHGRFVVYRAIDPDQVESATTQLRSMGAVVQVKPSTESLDMPAIEPDDEAGPLGDPSRYQGPVAHFADGGVGVAHHMTQPGGRPTPGIMPPPDFGVSRQPDPGTHTNFGPVPGLASASPRHAPVPMPAAGPVPSYAPPVQAPAAAPEGGMMAMVEQLEAASDGGPSVMTLDGLDSAAVEEEEEAREAAEAAADAAVAREVQPDAVQAPPIDPDAPLSLDLGATRPRPAPAPAAPMTAAPMQPAPMASAAQSAPTYAAPRAPMCNQGAVREPRGLFLGDEITNYLAGVAAASLLCLLVAFAVTRSSKRDAIVALEDEISESYRLPLKVEKGDVRAPSEIQGELDDLYGSARTQFMLILVLGVPIGLGIGRIRV